MQVCKKHLNDNLHYNQVKPKYNTLWPYKIEEEKNPKKGGCETFQLSLLPLINKITNWQILEKISSAKNL